MGHDLTTRMGATMPSWTMSAIDQQVSVERWGCGCRVDEHSPGVCPLVGWQSAFDDEARASAARRQPVTPQEGEWPKRDAVPMVRMDTMMVSSEPQTFEWSASSDPSSWELSGICLDCGASIPAMDHKCWKCSGPAQNIGLSAIGLRPAEVTPEMTKAAIGACHGNRDVINWADFTAIYRAMHAVAPVALVSDAEIALTLERDEAFSRASIDRSTISSLRAQVADLDAENDVLRDGKIPEAWRLDARRIETERDRLQAVCDHLVSEQARLAALAQDHINRRSKFEAENRALRAELMAAHDKLAKAENTGNHDYHGPTEEVPHPTIEGRTERRAVPDVAHEQFHRAVGDVLAGKIMPKAREQMRDALGRSVPDAPTTASTSRPMPRQAAPSDPHRMGLA